MKEAYNYKKVFEEPYVIYQITRNVIIPFGIPVTKSIIFLIVFGIMALCWRFFFALGKAIPGMIPVLYVGIPYGISTLVMRIKPNGKKLPYFLWDLWMYYTGIFLPKKKYAGDQEVLYLDQKEIRFTPVTIKTKEKEGKYAAEDTV
ncbi:hypothetical protein B7C51_08420 [Paenibacillus larvae subsp. pulvifaciens]|uniref:TcpE family protein n=1 Tax=Paenibacillus larvae subsp. pulvifaciens TaxID=1477 RepID=A0A1V0UQB0_9BACL|nr:TcpE family conjugal transfer membrane protein [Paenibacillus larvae]ARF67296.1 hypothetical protein B7C51_04835 [Paenibacillus larvae subsp. pulvifaciens]ARF67845.1 hypothetical protein B7C51_08420 [Paenibacillus larvae subsp. pulvifaciens]MCY9500079.1 conjugal transfer protein [Paenibacillus larvae]